jgi:hypothetical protein
MAIVLDGTTGITTPGINNTGTSTFAAGSAAAPSIAPDGDPNTGIFFPAADTIAFSEGGVEAIRLTSTGDLQFSATGQRITGDMSNATLSNRLAFQTTTANSATNVHAIPSGSSLQSGFKAESDPAMANGQFLSLDMVGNADARISSATRGSGTAVPMTFYTGGSERFRIDTAGQLGIGGANYGTSGQVLTSNGSGAAPSWQLPAGLPTMNIVSGTTQAAVANNHYVLTNASTTTVTLPAGPAAGAVVWITVANGRVDNVVARNGQNINSLAENMTLDNAYAGVQLRYADATRGWVFT